MNEGLTTRDARERLRRDGPNAFTAKRRWPAPLVWAGHIATDPMVLLLIAAGAVYLWTGDRTDAIAALVALVPIAALDVALELRTERAVEQLRRLAAPVARVIRDGALRDVAAEEIVADDVIEIREGDVVPADGSVFSAGALHVDESPLTGESDAIAKSPDGDREVFAGTRVLSGRAYVRVGATGMRTRYGAIADLLTRARTPATPLQVVIRRLFLLLTAGAVGVCLVVLALELARGTPPGDALIAAVGLAMAAIPEEIPVVSSLYLGLGAWRLARDHALIRRLSGVETLGMTTVVCTDKTGTLTEGRLRLVSVVPIDEASTEDVLEAAVLASEAEPFDPLDRAIVQAAPRPRQVVTLLRDHAFDAAEKYVSRVYAVGDGAMAYAKGSPETIARLSLPEGAAREAALSAIESHARAGERVVAVAAGPTERDAETRTLDERRLRYVGLLAFADPPRASAVEALAECRAAGVRVLVVTGDHAATALAVARAMGIATDASEVRTGADIDSASEPELRAILRTVRVFARTRPEQKLRIVRALREMGEVVAVTGDGINDGPALREAHIGIAMGRSGTAVAREAATLVLLDDDFGTIVKSIRDGRRIFDNLGRAISYLIAFHIPLVLVALVLPVVGAPLLLLPLHLVWLEVIVHPTSSLVFEADPARPDLMRRPPVRASALLPSRTETRLAIVRGIALTVGVLVLFLVRVGSDVESARGLAVTALILGQTLLVLAARAPDQPIWRAGVRNPILPFVLAVSVASVLLIPLVPPLAEVLHMRSLDAAGWAAALAVAGAAVLGPELLKRRGA